jgi:cbb3-type cytochrome oxidase maturation protein
VSGLVVLVPIALAMGLGALAAFLWALRAGQYEDLDGASQRVLNDDAAPHRGSQAAAPKPAEAPAGAPRG